MAGVPFQVSPEMSFNAAPGTDGGAQALPPDELIPDGLIPGPFSDEPAALWAEPALPPAGTAGNGAAGRDRNADTS